MNATVPLALFGWPFVVFALFACLPARRAVCLSFLLAWMFLPTAEYDIPGLPDYSKSTAASGSVLLATLVFKRDRLSLFRLSLLDVPMMIWCACPFATSLHNGLGAYDGLSGVLENTIVWGLPYVIGRLFLSGLADLRELAVLLFVGGLIYVPLCIFEMRMSPQLNQWIYGFGGAGIAYKELGKWGSRPYVFMGNGLTLGMFMTAASLCGFWLWHSASLTRLRGYSVGMLLVMLLITTLLCKNMGASALLLAGILCFLYMQYRRSSLAVWLLIAIAPAYMMLRGSGDWGGAAIADFAGSVHERRGESFRTRLENEDRLVAKAMEKPILGWGRWGRNRVFDEDGRDITLSDGLWVIVLGQSGIVGLVAITSVMLIPAVAFARRYSAPTWMRPEVAGAAALSVLVSLYSVDCLFNAMLNPVYVLAMGGLVSLVRTPQAVRHCSRASADSSRVACAVRLQTR